MYSILMDTKTKSFYMEKGELKFYAYSDPEECNDIKIGSKLVTVETDDYQEFLTFLYNSGFVYGYLDDAPIQIKKSDVLYYKQNSNEAVYAQYLLTKDERYLKVLRKSQLFTLCKVDNENGVVLFPTVKLDNGESAILAYTDASRIPITLHEKYDGYRTVRMTFDAPCIVNGQFIAA